MIKPPPPAPGRLSPGDAFGPRYRILRLLGAGGMGIVYHAWDEELGVAVALKVIRPEVSADPAMAKELEKRFKRELLLARKVSHHNVVRIHDIGEVDAIKYITMTYVDGRDLATILKNAGHLPTPEVLQLIRQLCAGLQEAHSAGVVHRDLKPANIMIAGEHLVIMDFGIARSVVQGMEGSAPLVTQQPMSRSALVTGATLQGAIVGTVAYMSPEQAKGQPADARSDIYAVGMIMRDMLVGTRATEDPTDALTELMERVQHAPKPVKELDPSIPDAVDRLVTRCLQPEPAHRYQTVTDLLADLNALDAEGKPIPKVRTLTRRTVLTVAAGVLGLVLGTWWLSRSPPPPRAHDPVSVLIADLQNATGDPSFDHALEPMLKLALEGAGFITAFDRTAVARSLGVRPPERLDERAALQLAVKQGLGVVLSGSIDRQGDGYGISVKATQAVTGTVISTTSNRAASKDQVLATTTTLANSVREALGDEMSGSAKRFATQTFSATSWEVVRQYATAAEALSRSKYEEALQTFSKAVALDPNFGLGYAGMAIASRNLDRQQDAEKHIKEAVRHLDGMTERERYRTRGLFYFITGDYQACVKEYGDLIARYAADAPARNNLALCLTYLRELPRAVGEMQEVIKILPRRALYRENLATYAAYSGDFRKAETEVRAIEEPGVFTLLPLAFAQTLQGKVPEAAATYEKIGKIDELGKSYMASGLGDLALYEGRFAAAARTFAQGAAADLASGDPDRAANKFAALAYAEQLRQENRAAIAAAEKALSNSKSVKIRFFAARVFVESGDAAKARTLAAGLGAELLAEPQAYAKIIEAGIALKNGDARAAIKTLTEANTLLDTWIGHFDLGRAYLEAGAFTQADSEFDRCIKRRGEALSLFLDEEPTYGVFPPVYYFQGRVREGLGSAGFAESYRVYLNIRGQSKDDPLLMEVRRRAGG
jgi:eukaryotic-like serine/threonine-protein kinase